MIYFVQETGLFRNRVKIGFTDKIKGRMAGLRGGSPSELKLLLVMPGDTHIEAAYHEKFEKYRLHGEWFRFGLWLKVFIWKNQSKPFVLDEKPNDTSLPEMVSESETMAITSHIQDLNGFDKNDVVVVGEPEPDKSSEKEMDAIEAFVSIRDGGKFSWNKAIAAAFGDGKTGKNYKAKLIRILDKFGIDYSEPELGDEVSGQSELLKPEEIAYALANPMGINRLAKALSIGSTKAKRLKEYVEDHNSTNDRMWL